jgi:hypothetical protein
MLEQMSKGLLSWSAICFYVIDEAQLISRRIGTPLAGMLFD